MHFYFHDIERKRKIASSIFLEKFSFSEFGDRTGRLNEAIHVIYTLDKGFSENKKDKAAFSLLCLVKSGWQEMFFRWPGGHSRYLTYRMVFALLFLTFDIAVILLNKTAFYTILVSSV